MKIGYITKENPNDIRAYSGTHYSMLKALEYEFGEVVSLAPLDHRYKYVAKVKGKLRTLGSDKVFKYQYDLSLAKKHAKLLDHRIEREKPDILLGSLVSPEVAYLKSDIPLYLTTDATFPLLNGLYNSHTNLDETSKKNAIILEKRAFDKAHKLILPLKWLAHSAVEHYGIQPSKIEVIPYGSNLETPEAQVLESKTEKRVKGDELRLLFVGVRWEEKGGPKAVEVARHLNKSGIKTTLSVIGVSPGIKESFVKEIGFLDKTNEKDLKQLSIAYEESHFFILPTKAECVGMSFIEAASYGLPSIGSNVGGVPEAVSDQKTGLICSDDSTPQDISKWITKVWRDKESYRLMSQKAREHYDDNMNWKNWGEKLREVIDVETV